MPGARRRRVGEARRLPCRCRLGTATRCGEKVPRRHAGVDSRRALRRSAAARPARLRRTDTSTLRRRRPAADRRDAAGYRRGRLPAVAVGQCPASGRPLRGDHQRVLESVVSTIGAAPRAAVDRHRPARRGASGLRAGMPPGDGVSLTTLEPGAVRLWPAGAGDRPATCLQRRRSRRLRRRSRALPDARSARHAPVSGADPVVTAGRPAGLVERGGNANERLRDDGQFRRSRLARHDRRCARRMRRRRPRRDRRRRLRAAAPDAGAHRGLSAGRRSGAPRRLRRLQRRKPHGPAGAQCRQAGPGHRLEHGSVPEHAADRRGGRRGGRASRPRLTNGGSSRRREPPPRNGRPCAGASPVGRSRPVLGNRSIRRDDRRHTVTHRSKRSRER